jgi:hypothetical protein
MQAHTGTGGVAPEPLPSAPAQGRQGLGTSSTPGEPPEATKEVMRHTSRQPCMHPDLRQFMCVRAAGAARACRQRCSSCCNSRVPGAGPSLKAANPVPLSMTYAGSRRPAVNTLCHHLITAPGHASCACILNRQRLRRTRACRLRLPAQRGTLRQSSTCPASRCCSSPGLCCWRCALHDALLFAGTPKEAVPAQDAAPRPPAHDKDSASAPYPMPADQVALHSTARSHGS